jgi:hypothetical protein
MADRCGAVSVVLCDSLYIGIWCVFVTYSNVVFMEGNWVVMGVQFGGLLYCVTVYILVFGVRLLRTAMLCLWKVIG